MLRAASCVLSPVRGIRGGTAISGRSSKKMPTTRAATRRAAAYDAAATTASVTPVSRIVKTSGSDVPVETVHLSAKEGTKVRMLSLPLRRLELLLCTPSVLSLPPSLSLSLSLSLTHTHTHTHSSHTLFFFLMIGLVLL